MKHEKNTLEDIVKARNSFQNADSIEVEVNADSQLTKAVTKLFALAEAYPELKANQNFLLLSNELSSVEDEIAQSRKYYNAVIRAFNNKVEMVPSNIIAKILGYKAKEMFKVDNF